MTTIRTTTRCIRSQNETAKEENWNPKMSKDDLIAKHKRNTEQVRNAAPLHADVLDMFKGQLLICFLRRLGAEDKTVKIPVAEVDGTGDVNLSFCVVDGQFEFSLTKKPS